MNSKQLRERLLRSGLATSDSIHGCTAQELQQIERAAGFPLPLAYADFMAQFGKRAGRLLRDVDMFFPGILSFNPAAVELLEDCSDRNLSLPKSAFVFGMRNKEQFMFFSAGQPSIYFYMFGDASISRIADSFWEVIADELDLCEDNYRQIRGTHYDLRSE